MRLLIETIAAWTINLILQGNSNAVKNIVLSITFFLISAPCAMSQVVNQRITDSDGYEQLLGRLTEEALSSPPFSTWYVKRVEQYAPNRQILKQIRNLDDYEIEIFFGTWCGDSRREVPKFIKTLHELDFPGNQLSIIGLNRTKDQYKQSPNGEEVGKKIYRIPTFVFYKDGKEVNRIVEFPVVSLEKDILTITSGQQYTPNYLIIAELDSMLENTGYAAVSDEADSIARKLKPLASRSSDLASYGYVQLYRQNIDEAVAIFEVNRLLYPDDFIVYKSLADAYYNQGSYNEAKVNYSKALELLPDDEDILRMLDEVAVRQ